MSTCDPDIRDALAEVAAGRADAATAARVRAHRATCTTCEEEGRVLEALASDAAMPSPEIAARLERAVARAAAALPPPSGRRRTAAWTLAAAAAAVLALGTPALMERASRSGSGAELATDAATGSLWVTEGALVAGAPVLDDLTDDELARLLEEW